MSEQNNAQPVQAPKRTGVIGTPFTAGPDPRRSKRRLTLPSLMRRLGASASNGAMERAAEAVWKVAADSDHPYWFQTIELLLNRFDGKLESAGGRSAAAGIGLQVVQTVTQTAPTAQSDPLPTLTITARPSDNAEAADIEAGSDDAKA